MDESRRPGRHALWILAGSALPLLAFTCHPGGPALERCTDSPLLDSVRAGGPLRVIATLDVALRPETELTQDEIEAQRQALEAVRSEVVATLEGTASEVVRIYEALPQIALSVDETGLCRVLASPRVTGVAQDRPEPPTG